MISRFFECLVPISSCNLYCEYCYVIQGNRRNIKIPGISYSVSQFRKAISLDRLGGVCFFSFCGSGETLLCEELPELVQVALETGHIVNITNNGTITQKIDHFLNLPIQYQKNLLFSFSLHYTELKKRNLLGVFAKNVKNVMKSDISCFVSLNLCDDYIENINQIKEYCLDNFGVLPQVALTRIEGDGYSIFSKLTPEEYKSYGDTFQSPLFEYTYNNFKVKREEYCHAGEVSYCLNLATGDLKRCYAETPFMNFFDESITEIPRLPIGKYCKSKYCVNSSHFLSLGAIPDFDNTSYAFLRQRENGWIKNNVLVELSQKLKCRTKDTCELFLASGGDNIVIYGAGRAAREVLCLLRKRNIVPKQFVVKHCSDNPCEIEGIKVFGLEEAARSIKKMSVIIAIKNYSVINEVQHELETRGIYHIFNYYDVLAT